MIDINKSESICCKFLNLVIVSNFIPFFSFAESKLQLNKDDFLGDYGVITYNTSENKKMYFSQLFFYLYLFHTLFMP